MIIHLQPVVGSFAENKEKAKELRVNKIMPTLAPCITFSTPTVMTPFSP